MVVVKVWKNPLPKEGRVREGGEKNVSAVCPRGLGIEPGTSHVLGKSQ